MRIDEDKVAIRETTTRMSKDVYIPSITAYLTPEFSIARTPITNPKKTALAHSTFETDVYVNGSGAAQIAVN